MTRRWSRLLIAAAVLAALTVAFVATAASRREPTIPLARVERRPFVRTVVARGVLEAVQATPVSVPSELTRPVKVAWIAEDGSRVGAGDVVVRLDPTDFESELRDGLAGAESSGERIAKAEAALDATLEGLGLDAEVARREREVASHFQLLDEEIFSRFERIESALDLELAEAKLEHAEEVKESKRELSEADLRLLRLQREQAEREVTQARQGLESMEVQAPHDGIFLLQRSGWRNEVLKIGDMAWPGMTVAQIPELSTMQAQVHVLEADAGGLAAGQTARVVIDAAPERTWKGEVLRVEPVAKPWVPGSPVQYFGVTLALERTDPALMKPGQRLAAEIEMESIPQALVVPRAAVFQGEGENVVHRRAGGGFEAIPVEVVSAGLGWTAIQGEIAPGDTVALEDPSGAPRSAPPETATAPTTGPPRPSGSPPRIRRRG
ncbi:MAG: efflux RND transporter periplasmic adaptor subunit [Thermoanaerobaculia bacterium]